ncbi:MAG: ABC transporter permease [Planctomycetes bacterium]|nr:ABC transporter permease [Planctomycetota bacterium]
MNFLQITLKDLLLLSRDRRTLFVLIALPLAFIAIIGSSTGQLFSQAEAARKYKVGIVDADKTELSGQLVEALQLVKGLEAESYPTKKAARQALAEDKIHVLVHIGPKYHTLVEELEVIDIVRPEGGRLQGNVKALDVAVEAGPFLANASNLLEIVVLSITVKTISPTVLEKNAKLKRQIELAALKSRTTPTETETEELPDFLKNKPDPPSINVVVYQTVVPGYTVMFVFFIMSFMARSFIGEHDMGTLNRLRLAPISRPGMMIGKTIPFFIISLVQTSLLFLAGKLLFGMDWGHTPWMLLPVMFCTSTAATALGLLVASLVRTEAQVTAYGNFLVLTMAGISGCMMPRSWQPEFMQKLGLVTPHAWALIAYDQILNRPEPDLSVVLHCCGTMLAFAAGYFAIGWWRSRGID